ncbi:hypothetical protein BgiBS90_016362, partial [Biomphalaria glabrata]
MYTINTRLGYQTMVCIGCYLKQRWGRHGTALINAYSLGLHLELVQSRNFSFQMAELHTPTCYLPSDT